MLAASVHQLNSPLSAVRTLSKLLLRRLDGDDTTNRELASAARDRTDDLPTSRPLGIGPTAAGG